VSALELLQRRTLRLLSAAQVLGGLGVGAGVAVTTLLAFELSGSAALAGLAASASAFGAGIGAALIGASSARGRRPGLVAGYLVGLSGAVLAVLAAVVASFPLMVGATLLFGASNASKLQARYAATDLATAERRGSDLSMVVWATTVGAVLGPNLIGPGVAAADLLGVPELAGPYLLSAAGFAAAAAVLAIGLRPDPLLVARSHAADADAAAAAVAVGAMERGLVVPAVVPPTASGRASGRGALAEGLHAVASDRSARAAIAALASAQAVMVGVMVMTPVHMGDHGAAIRVIGLTISLHILGMYAFSPVFGRLVDRLGSRMVLGLGFGQLAAAVALSTLSDPYGGSGFLLGLLLLGTGWSAALIASSALLTEVLPLESRAPAQGLSDLATNLAGGAAGALSGVLMTLLGFPLMAATTLLLLVVPVAMLLADSRRVDVAVAVDLPR
jgi:MFS family permease